MDVRRKIEVAIGEHGKLAHGQEMDFKMVWSHLKIFWGSLVFSSGQAEEVDRRTEEVGRQYICLVCNFGLSGRKRVKVGTGMNFTGATRAAEIQNSWKKIVTKSSCLNNLD